MPMKKLLLSSAYGTWSIPNPCFPTIAAALTRNARVLVVCNTVGQALTLQRAAEACPDIPQDALFHHSEVVTPHHGRYAPEDREQMDATVSKRLGKGSDGGTPTANRHPDPGTES